MIELTSRADKRVRYFNPDKIVSVGTFIRRALVPSPSGFGQSYADTDEGGEEINYILLQGAGDVDEVVETNAEVMHLMHVWRNRTAYSNSARAHAVSLTASSDIQFHSL